MSMHSPRTPDALPSLRDALHNRVTLGLSVLFGGVLVLAYASVVPIEAIVVAYPAYVAVLLVDTFLYNVFGIETGLFVWGVLAMFVYVEAVILSLIIQTTQSWVAAYSDS